jgi:hypothetical protein
MGAQRHDGLLLDVSELHYNETHIIRLNGCEELRNCDLHFPLICFDTAHNGLVR